jgi:hypothetical protein
MADPKGLDVSEGQVESTVDETTHAFDMNVKAELLRRVYAYSVLQAGFRVAHFTILFSPVRQGTLATS